MIVAILFLTSMLVEFGFYIENKFKINVLVESLPVFMSMSCLFFMGITFNIQSDLFEDLWQMMQDDWAEERREEETKIKNDYAETGLLMAKSLAGLALSGVVIFVTVTPFLAEILDYFKPLNESRSPLLPFPAIEVFQMDGVFYQTLIVEEITTFVCITYGVAFTCIASTHCMHANGMFAVIGYRLENLLPENLRYSTDYNLVSENCRKSLVVCIKRHQLALQFMSLVDEYYGPAVAIYVIGSIFMVSPTLTMLADTKFHYMAVVQILIIVGFLYMISYLGQKVIDMSSELSQKAYLGDWSRGAPHVQRLIMHILRRSEKYSSINALSLFTLSFDFFRMLLLMLEYRLIHSDWNNLGLTKHSSLRSYWTCTLINKHCIDSDITRRLKDSCFVHFKTILIFSD
ncbi:uncharacterized protein [Prorops nasuta]|uniref:uncharacterized protein n=1 Tax=Prorops nasuta TaxID=863751 RepID=UPI0034CD1117